jgi:alkylated DNA nucleotide flippase Atl1
MQKQVQHTLVKRQHGQPMVSVNVADLRARYGIVGDINANPLSPRQVLLLDGEVLATYGLAPGTLRENIVVTGADLASLPSGTVLQIGEEALIRLTFECEVCTKIASCGVRPLRDLTGKRGNLGVVLHGGTVYQGDSVSIRTERYESLPSKLYDRFLWVTDRVPEGKVINYRILIGVLGVSESYLRVLPGFIKRAGPDHPVHRIVDTLGCLVPYSPCQERRLASEGVYRTHHGVDLAKHSWDTSELYYS